MPRGKKVAKELSPKEKLEQALVPDWEQPYKVPENWCWTYFKLISKIRTGKKDANYGSEDGEYPFFTCAAEPIRCHGYSFECNAMLLAGNGDINNINRYNGKFEAYQRTYVVETIEPINIDYIFYWFKYRWFDFNKDKMFGTAIPYIRLGNLQEFPIPVAPLPEQQRIVDRIESLFAKLDEAKEKAQAVVDGFELRKSAILHKAFMGELTEQWRKEHGVELESWKTQTINDLCSLIVDCPHSTPKWTKTGKICLKTTNIKRGYLDLSELHYVSEKTYVQRNQRATPQSGDLLLTREGSIGDIGVIPDGFDICLGQRMMLLRPARCSANFLIYFFLNPKIISDIKAQTMGSTAPRMNLKDLKQLSLKCPSESEQQEIVHILDNLFCKEQQAKEAAEAVLSQIDTMKKAILARAFRGELGTNDPAEESGVELLKQILDTPIESKKPIKRIFIPKALESRIKTDLERKIIKLYIQNNVNALSIERLMSVSSKKFDVMATLRNLQQREILVREKDNYKLLG